MAVDATSAREDRDIYRLSHAMDEATLQVIADRLEFRATDPGYVALSQAYFARLPLASARRILALGCGTGVEVRALKRATGTAATIVGIDHSPHLIAAARQRTAAEGLDDGIEYRVGDAHRLDVADGSFEVVLLHTLISHVDEPLGVLREAGRVVAPGGTIAIFDGDYASLTFGYPDAALARTIEEVLLKLLIGNPRVMRDLPRLLREAGLTLVEGGGVVYADIGTGSFFANVPEAYAGVLSRSGLLPQAVIDAWRACQARAVHDNTFFGASNYYTSLARRPR